MNTDHTARFIMNQLEINPQKAIECRESTKQTVVCQKTGICFAISIPQLPSLGSYKNKASDSNRDSNRDKEDKKAFSWHMPILEFSSPFSYWSNVKAVLQAPREYLLEADKKLIAGVFIAALDHYDLLESGLLQATELNAIFCLAESHTLINLMGWLGKLTDKKAMDLPRLLVDWQDVRANGAKAVEKLLSNYTMRLKPHFNEQEKEEQRIQAIRASQTQAAYERILSRQGRTLAGGQLLSGKQTLAHHEKEFEARLQQNKKRLKVIAGILAGQERVNSRMSDMLATLAMGRSLVILASDMRQKLISRLKQYETEGSKEAGEAAQILADSHNPYDVLCLAEAELDSVSEILKEEQKAQRPKTIAEILAAKKAAAFGVMASNSTASSSSEV